MFSYNAEEEYQKFAGETYGQMRGDMAEALQNSRGMPILVVSGELHSQSFHNDLADFVTPDSLENPSQAAMYTHFAAVQAAADLVGKENVIVSVEIPPEYRNIVESWSQTPPDMRDERMPYYGEVAAYAHEHGYEIAYDDPLNRAVDSEDQRRFDGEIEAIGKHALRVESAPKIVVHLGGATHIGTLQGHSYNDIFTGGGSLTKEQAIDPFEGIYGQRLFYNSAQTNVSIIEARLFGGGEMIDYLMNPANAEQIDPPGALPEDTTLEDVVKDIERARLQFIGSQDPVLSESVSVNPLQPGA